MFSQFRQAVEQLAQQVPVVAHSTSEDGSNPERRSSLDIRRSISQRSGDSTTTSSGSNGRASTTTPPNAVRKSNLEERLRRVTHAAIVEGSPTSSTSQSSSSASGSGSTSTPTNGTTASSAPSPDPAKKARSSSTASHKRTMSPASTPLPQSPALLAAGADPLTRTTSNLSHSETIPDLELDSEKGKDAAKDQSLEEGDTKGLGAGTTDKDQVTSAGEVEVSDPLTKDVAPSTELQKRDGEETTAEDAVPKTDEAREDIKSEPVATDAEPAKEAEKVEERGENQEQEESSRELVEEPLPIETSSGSTSSSLNELESAQQELLPPPEPVETEPPKSQGPEPTLVESSPKAKPPGDTEFTIASTTPSPTESNQRSKEPTPTREAPKPKATGVGVEELQQRLKQVEQRFTDVSTSFKRLQAEKVAADAVLKDLTPIDTIQDTTGLRDYLKNLNDKQEIFQSEVKLLNSKLSNYEERLEELRDVHRLESKSQTDQIDKLKTQLAETEALFQASEKAVAEAEGKLASDTTDSEALQGELERYKTIASQEEEKRVKAVSLLKTVRQKLVKAEKEKEDALREVAASKERDRGEKEKDYVEKLKLQQEMEMMQIEKEKAVAAQKAQFEREMGSAKERFEKELAAVKGQLELEIITLKSSHAKELAAKASKISALENSLNGVARDKNVFFEQLQIKQAETESAQSHLESLQHQNTELEFQLREANDRLALIKEEYADYQREQETKAREPVTSASDIAHMISATESKYEVKLAEMKRSVGVLEKERSESEANWSRKLKEKVRELEELKQLLGSAAKSREQDINVGEQLKADLGRAREEVRILKEQLLDVPALQEQIQDLKKTLKEKDEEVHLKSVALEHQAEEQKSREAQLKQANKTLREELRKVQSSAALLERQRNPGVGYWNRVAADGDGVPQSPAISTTSELSVRSASPRPDSPAPSTASVSTSRQEEEVNLEYLRNVILQFLEHKEMRPNLVKVISIILHFTPQETRRLMAKV